MIKSLLLAFIVHLVQVNLAFHAIHKHNYILPCLKFLNTADFWEYQLRLAGISPSQSRIPEYPKPVYGSGSGPITATRNTVLTSRSAKKRAAKKLRKERQNNAGRTRSLDPDAERLRLTELLRVAREQYEKACEELDALTGSQPEPADEDPEELPETDPPAALPEAETEQSQAQTLETRTSGDSALQLPLRGESYRSPQAAADTLNSVSNNQSVNDTTLDNDASTTLRSFYNAFNRNGLSQDLGSVSDSQPVNNPLSGDSSGSRPRDSYLTSLYDNEAQDRSERWEGYRTYTDYRTQVATDRQDPGPSRSSYHPVSRTFRTGHYSPTVWSDDGDADIYVNVGNTRSPPSDTSEDEYNINRWRPSASATTHSVSTNSRKAPLLSPESKELAENISVLLELLSRTEQVDMDEDGQGKIIENAFESISKLREQYQATLAQRDESATKLQAPEEEVPNLEIYSGCIVCCDQIADTLLTPCNHLALCAVSREAAYFPPLGPPSFVLY